MIVVTVSPVNKLVIYVYYFCSNAKLTTVVSSISQVNNQLSFEDISLRNSLLERNKNFVFGVESKRSNLDRFL